jgi:protein phosphatase
MAKPAEQSVPAALLQALDEANQAVSLLSHRLGAVELGTTLLAAVIHDQALHWVSVGDSRLYLWRAGQLSQLSQDHSYADDLDRAAANGIISDAEATNHPERRSLTSYLGLRCLDLIDRNSESFPLWAGDRLLLCSDGLYAALEESEVAPLFSRDAQQTAEDLVAFVLAQQRRGQDNLTVAILACA